MLNAAQVLLKVEEKLILASNVAWLLL